MSMKKEKLLEVLDSWKASLKEQNNWNASFVPGEGWVWDDKQAYQQIKEMIKLFYSPLGHMTKYDPKEEWIKDKITELLRR